MTVNLKCCVQNQSDLIYSNFNGFTNKLFKSITLLGRNLNKNSISLIDNLRNKLVIFHTSKYLQYYIYICTLLYTTLICCVHNSVRMNTKHAHQWKQGKFHQFCTTEECLAVKDNKTEEIRFLSYTDFVENES